MTSSILTKADMATRWGVTRQVVNNWENRHSDFPKPIMTVQNGSLPLYLESDVMVYEIVIFNLGCVKVHC